MPKSRYAILALILILLAAAVLRFYGLRWDDGLSGYPHPDERHLANTMLRIAIPRPVDWDLLLNDSGNSPLNPRKLIPDGSGEHYDLAYGTLPVYVYRAAAITLARITADPWWDSYPAYRVVGRAITGLFSLLTVFWVYLIGRRTFDGRTGLLAAALLATCVLHIQLSHFMTVDLLMSALLTAGLLFGVRFAQEGRTGDAIGMGAMLGLSIASKFNGITLSAGIAAAYIVAWLGRKRTLRELLAFCVPLTLVFWFLGFAAFEYYAVRDPYTYSHAIGTQAKMVSGETDWPYTRQYVNTAPYLFQLKNLVVWGMGWPLGLVAVAGTVASIVGLVADLVRSSREPEPAAADLDGSPGAPGVLGRWFAQSRTAGLLVLLGWALPFFAYTARLEVKFLRYMLPLTPVLCLLAAHLLCLLGDLLARGWRRLRGQDGRGQAVLRWAPAALVLIPSLLWSLAYMRVYAQEHPWQAASRWFYDNALKGSFYTWEAWGDRLPADLPEEDLYRAEHGLLDRDLWMRIYADMLPEDKLGHIASSLRQADYVILSTPRLYLSVARLPWRYPVELRYYDLLFREQLGYELVGRFTAFPGLGPWQVNDLAADQSFFDYEHPLVLIYRKERDLSEAEWRELFAEQLRIVPEVTREGDEPPIELPIP